MINRYVRRNHVFVITSELTMWIALGIVALWLGQWAPTSWEDRTMFIAYCANGTRAFVAYNYDRDMIAARVFDLLVNVEGASVWIVPGTWPIND